VAIGQIEYSKHSALLNQEKLSDEELVRVFLERQDEAAFDQIVNRYGDKIYTLALRITRNHSDAEEVLQKVFIALMKKMNTFRGESKFSTWLHKVASNTSYIYLRSRKKKYENEPSLEDYAPYNESGVLEGVQIKDWTDTPDGELLSREAMEIIESAVNELPVTHRVVFHLRDVEGFSNEEVAKALGVSLGAVKSRIHRARLFLRDRLSDYFYEWRK
jgi:RNA polymerase sigma-70 factor (ECF subfamily)